MTDNEHPNVASGLFAREPEGAATMTMGLPCDREGYDLRMTPCPKCGSRGCPELHRYNGKCSEKPAGKKPEKPEPQPVDPYWGEYGIRINGSPVKSYNPNSFM
jgi:hypothetical protein